MVAQFRRWTHEEFERESQVARELFVRGRTGAGDFAAQYRQIHSGVFELLRDTHDLATIHASVVNADPRRRFDLGYLCMPPISADDLRTIVSDRLGRKVLSPEVCDRLISTTLGSLDPLRFPWVQEGRRPTEQEREVAIVATATLILAQRVQTARRNTTAAAQQQAVSECLIRNGFAEVTPRPKRIESLDQLERGTFCGETLVGRGAAKADRPVRLRDGRLLAIGCKVTNSAINSKKRLLKDIASDAAQWRHDFGSSCIPAAVVSGVVDVPTLVEAQDVRETFIVWQHDLTPLEEFLAAAR